MIRHGAGTAPAPQERLRAELARRQVVGTFVKLRDAEVVDIIAAAGFDFVIVDLEHSQLGDADVLRLTRHAAAVGLPTIVRLADCNPGLINRCLEAGAAGIQLSGVRTADTVDALVAATRYAPTGRRSVSLAHPMAGYGAVSLREAVTGPNPLLVGQIEHGEAEDPLPDILTAGLDVVFLGMTDLTVDLAFDDDRVKARVDEVVEAAEAAGVTWGSYTNALADAPAEARYVAVSSDLALLREAAGKAVHDR